MLKVTIEGVLPDGESVNKVIEGIFVSAFVVNRAEDGSEMHGVALGGGLTPQDYVEHVVYAVVDNIKKMADDAGEKQKLLERAMDLIGERLDEPEEESEKKSKNGRDVKVAVLAGDDAKEFLKGLLK